jgi:hypothetical protein
MVTSTSPETRLSDLVDQHKTRLARADTDTLILIIMMMLNLFNPSFACVFCVNDREQVEIL